MADMCKFSGYPHRTPAMRAIVRRRIALRITGAVLWLGFWVVSCGLWGRDNEYMSQGNWILLGTLIGLLGWKIFKLGVMLRDKPFDGTITSMKLAYVWHSDTPWLRGAMKKEPQITATVDIGGEEPIKFKFPVKDIHPKDYYAVGDRVRHYRCLPYLEKEDKPEDIVICADCGKYSYITEDVCEFCKKPLLK